MYFLAGSAVCLKVIPAFEVMSSSCGISRPVHFVAFAPGGGGGGCGCPPCALASRAARSKTIKNFASLLQRFLFKGFPRERISWALNWLGPDALVQSGLEILAKLVFAVWTATGSFPFSGSWGEADSTCKVLEAWVRAERVETRPEQDAGVKALLEALF